MAGNTRQACASLRDAEWPPCGGSITRVPMAGAATRYFHSTDVEVLNRLHRLLELSNPETGHHIRRVKQISYLIALQLALSPEEALIIRDAAPLHDVGKILTPDHILEKKGPLTPQEQEIMRLHTLHGAEILGGGQSILLRTAEMVARHHHERFDGWGYPSGLAGKDIPLAARIVAVADALDALAHDRAYRPALPGVAVARHMRAEAGRQFAPDVIEALWAAMSAPGADPSEDFIASV